MSSLLQFADINSQYAFDNQLKREDVAKLEEWQRLQPHLPPPLHPIETALFLHSCYYSNEAAKKCIDMFYTMRTRWPEMNGNRYPFDRDVQQGLNLCNAMALPEVTPEGYMVLYVRLQDLNVSAYHYNAVAKVCNMVLDIELKRRGCHMGHIGIIDLQGATLAHFLKCPIMSVRKSVLYLQCAVPMRLKSIHFVNSAMFMDKVLALVKPFCRKDLQDLIYVHFGDNSTIFKFVPKHILPIECGGSTFCAKDYYNNVVRKDFLRHAEYFANEENRVVDESKRPTEMTSITDIFGVEGTFKTLHID